MGQWGDKVEWASGKLDCGLNMRAAKTYPQFAAGVYSIEFLFIPQIEIVRDLFTSDLVPAIESRPEKIQRASAYFRDTVPEPVARTKIEGDIGDRHRIAKVFLDRNRQATINLMFVQLFHLVQQQLVELVRITRETDEQRDQEFRGLLQAVFETTDIDVTFLPAWPSLEELWWIANVVKHVEAGHTEKLRARRLELFRDPDSLVQSILDHDKVTRPVRMALGGIDFFPDIAEYTAKSNSVLEFWKELVLVLRGVKPRPKTLKDWVFEQREPILTICKKHGADNVRVFGSVARNEAGPTSDIDLLVSIPLAKGSWLPSTELLKNDLEQALDRKFDVVSDQASNKGLLGRALKDAVPI